MLLDDFSNEVRGLRQFPQRNVKTTLTWHDKFWTAHAISNIIGRSAVHVKTLEKPWFVPNQNCDTM